MVSVVPSDVAAAGSISLKISAEDYPVGAEPNQRDFNVEADPAGVTYITANSCQDNGGDCEVTKVAGDDQSSLQFDISVADKGTPSGSASVTASFVVGGEPDLVTTFNNEPIVFGMAAADSVAYFDDTPVVVSARWVVARVSVP